MIQANSVAIVVLALPKQKLGRGIGIQGAAQALGLALGPTVGGLLIALGGWRLIFFVNVPAGIVGTVMAWYLIPRSRHLQRRVPFDWLGLGLFFPAVAAFLSAVSFGNSAGWTSPIILGLFLAALALAATFVQRERRVRAPMLDLTLFKRVPFAAGIASGLLSYLVLFGTLFVVPFYLERALHPSPGRSGLMLGVMPIALGLTAPLAGRLAERLGARPLTVAGMAISAAMMGALIVAHGTLGGIVPSWPSSVLAWGCSLPQQRRHHGLRTKGAVGDGERRAQHDPGHGHGHGPGLHRPGLRAGGRLRARLGRPCHPRFRGLGRLPRDRCPGCHGPRRSARKTGLNLDPVASAE